jgi:Mrp family chromosome partitioning ATPase/capsular polysaccharide biosynthesis protein
MEPVQYLRAVRRRWKIIAVCVLLGLALGYVSSIGAQKKHDETTYWRATYTLYYDATAVSEKGGAFTALPQMGLLATSGDVPAKIAQADGLEVNSLSARIQAETNTALATLKITVTGQDATETVNLANQVGDTLIQYISDKHTLVYTDQVAAALKRVDDLKAQIAGFDSHPIAPNSVESQERDALSNQLRLALDNEAAVAVQGQPGQILLSLEKPEAIPINGSQFTKFVQAGALGNNNLTVSAATQASSSLDSTLNPKSKIPTGPIPRSMIGGLFGLLVGLAAAFVVERLDSRIHTKEDAELAFDLPVLCEVPPLTRSQRNETEVLSYSHPMSRTAEAYRALRSSLVFLRQTLTLTDGGDSTAGPDTTQVILVTSAGPAEGKTTTVANLAALFAEAEYSVLVINCDFRRPRLHRFLGGSDERRKVVQSDVPGVRMVNNVLSTPNPNPAEVAAAQRQVVETARGMFDVVLLDTAPLLSTNDASELVGSCDVVVLVAQAGKTTKPSAARATEVLQRMEATVAGIALVGTRDVPNAQYYYYANEIGRDPNRPEAESHPLDLLIRPETAGPKTGGPTANGSPANGGPVNGSRAPASPGTPAGGADVESEPVPPKDE